MYELPPEHIGHLPVRIGLEAIHLAASPRSGGRDRPPPPSCAATYRHGRRSDGQRDDRRRHQRRHRLDGASRALLSAVQQCRSVAGRAEHAILLRDLEFELRSGGSGRTDALLHMKAPRGTL